MAFQHYRDKLEIAQSFKCKKHVNVSVNKFSQLHFIFLDTAPTERMTKRFDIMIGRFPKRGITKSKWETKKLQLQKMLHVLNTTEQIANGPDRDRKKKLPDATFMSTATLVAPGH
jgi:hypothetical protein